MISYRTGNILAAETEVLVNTVNCVGVMGRGIALQFKQAFPENFKDYEAACNRGEVQPGRMFVHPISALGATKFIVNFPTKRHWRGASRIEDIEAGLVDLRRFIESESITSISIPPLGAGLGGLPWPRVRAAIENALSEISDHVQIVVFEPNYVVSEMPAARNRQVRMTPGRASLITLMEVYLRGLMEPDITLLEIHKLMFFLQEAGQPLRLQFVKAAHGPYAENLRHVLNDTEGTLTSGYMDGGDSPSKRISIVPGATEDARLFLEGDPNVRARIGRVKNLVEGYETPFGVELLATVYWLTVRNPNMTNPDLLLAVHRWDPSKAVFDLEQVAGARKRMLTEGWLDPV